MSQIQMIKIPYRWADTLGRGVAVGIIDSEITLSDSNSNIRQTDDATPYIQYHHGNDIFRIIRSVAPLCHIDTVQALKGRVGTRGALLLAIKEMINIKPDIVNISLSTPIDDASIRESIMLLSKSSIIVSAMANNGKRSYPAEYDCVISVSSYDKNNINSDVYCSGSFFTGESAKKTGNSMSTAFVSGILALAKSYDKNLTKETFLKQLLE